MPGLSRAVRDYRFGQMTAFMREHGYDALAFSSVDWIEWAANHYVFEKPWERPALFVVTADDKAFGFFSELSRPAITDILDTGQMWADDIIFYTDSPYATPPCAWVTPRWDEMVAETLVAAGLGKARIGAEALPGPLAKAAQRLPEAEFAPAGMAMRKMRWVKHPEEIATMQAAADLSDWAMATYRDELRPGRLCTEVDFAVASRITTEAARRHPDASFWTTSVFTVSGALVPWIHGEIARVDRRIQDNDVAVSQISSRLNGVFMELARPWIIGSPPAELMAFVECSREAQEAGIAAAMPGRPVSGIQVAAQNVINRRGFGANFRIRCSHGIGVIMHDFPENLPFEDRPLLEGETYAIEPGLYTRGLGGSRFADIVAIRADGPERITRSPKETAQITLGGAKSKIIEKI